MMKKTLVSCAVLASVAASALPLPSLAHGGATGIVKERMDAMGMMGDAVKALKSMMQGKSAYDADKVREHARVIEKHSGDALTKAFPHGSIKGPSEARPEIWSDWERFSALSKQLEDYAAGLALAAQNEGPMSQKQSMGSMMGGASMMNGTGMKDGAGMMGQMMGHDGLTREQLAQMPARGVFTMLVQTCSACHTDFRVEKK